MAYINEKGYLERVIGTKTSRGGQGQSIKRSWWFVKYRTNMRTKRGGVVIKNGYIGMPERYIGKKIMFKVEVIPDNK